MPEQHPVQVAESQVQLPEAQVWPAPHAGPEPQAQVPSMAQASARLASQVVQPNPAVPHVASDRTRQFAP